MHNIELSSDNDCVAIKPLIDSNVYTSINPISRLGKRVLAMSLVVDGGGT